VALFGGLAVTKRYYSGATLVETATHGALVLDALTPRGFRLGPLLATTVHVSGATVTHAIWRSLAGVDVLRFEAADLSPVPLLTQTGRRLNAADPVLPGVVVTADPDLPVAPPAVRAMSWSLPDSTTAGVPVAGSATNDGNVDQAWSISGTSGLTVTPSSGTLPPGDSQALSAVAAAAGEYVMTLAAAGATITGNPQTLVVSAASNSIIRPPPFGVSAVSAIGGDSMNEHFFLTCPLYRANGLLGAPLDFVANSAVSGRSIRDIRLTMANSYKDASGQPGFGGLPPLGWLFIPSQGTNGFRGPGSLSVIDSGTQADFLSVIEQGKTFAQHMVIGPITPVVGVTNSDSPWRTLAAFQRAACETDTSGLVHFLDATDVLLDESGGGNPAYFQPDGYHLSPLGCRVFGERWSELLQQLLINQGYPDAPLVTDPADVYPATNQWTTNPTNAGSGSTPTGVSVGQYGTGFVASSAIVAAGVGDPIEVPWLRVLPTALGASGYALAVTMTGNGRAVTAVDPQQFEHIVQLRFNDLQGCRLLESWSQKTTGEKITQKAYLQLDERGETATVTLRLNFYRFGATVGGPIEHAIYLWSAGAASGELGSVDIRCWSLRG
jgi:hypothetical protein